MTAFGGDKAFAAFRESEQVGGIKQQHFTSTGRSGVSATDVLVFSITSILPLLNSSLSVRSILVDV